MIKIGLTGSSGILGKNFSKLISQKKNYKTFKFKKNILNKSHVFKWISKHQFDIILHFAALVPTNQVNKNFILSKKTNVQGTKNMVDSIIKTQKKRTYFFFSSTSHVYKFNLKKIDERSKVSGISKYGKTKILAEKYVKKNSNKIDFCIGRISSLVSENQSKDFFLLNLIHRGKKGRLIRIRNSNVIRNFIHVSDVSKIILRLIENREKGVINISNKESTHFKKLFGFLYRRYNFKIKADYKRPEYLDLSNTALLKRIGKFRFMKLNKIIEKIYVKSS